MEVLFTADIHIKLGQKNVPTEWAKNRYRDLFRQLRYLSKSVHLTILGGDIFDKLPTIEELELYFELVTAIESDVIIYAGNHEALKKNTTFLTNLKSVTSLLNYKAEIIDDFVTYEGIDFIPYNKLKERWPDTLNSRILCTHVRGEIPPHVKPEIDLSLFDKWQVVLAGDLHSYSNSQLNILYPGSPLTTSFHRNNVNTGVIILDTDTLQHKWVKLDLPQLIRKTIQAGEPMPQTEYDHTIYEVEGDMSSLSNMENSELLEKKVVKRSTDTALILEPSMTMAQELEEYLRYILKLNNNVVDQLLKEFNDAR